jgi:hypothetical protein
MPDVRFDIQEVRDAEAKLDAIFQLLAFHLSQHPKMDSITRGYLYDLEFSFRDLQIMIGRLVSTVEEKE